MLISSHRKPQAPAVRGHAARKALLRRAIEKATTDSTGCCARAASGHAAAPLSSVMNARLFS